MAFSLVSPDFRDGDRLPQWTRSGTAGGEDRSPTLHWEDPPSGTRSFAITVWDPDAPVDGGWWHWAVVDLPATVRSLPADAGTPEAALLPPGAVTLPNQLQERRFQGAAPPAGHGEHRYLFRLSALDVERLELPANCTPAMLAEILPTHEVARAQLKGTSSTP